jgi:hypothetical protein
MKNWYGQRWTNTQIKYPLDDRIKQAISLQAEMPNLMAPFWDARLTASGG